MPEVLHDPLGRGLGPARSIRRGVADAFSNQVLFCDQALVRAVPIPWDWTRTAIVSDKARFRPAGEVLPSEEPMRQEFGGWLEPTIDRILHFVALPQGWDGSSAPPVQPGAVARALELLQDVLGSHDRPVPTIAPTPRGGLHVEWHGKQVEVELEIPAHGPIMVTYDDHVRHEEWDGTFSEGRDRVIHALLRLA